MVVISVRFATHVAVHVKNVYVIYIESEMNFHFILYL